MWPDAALHSCAVLCSASGLTAALVLKLCFNHTSHSPARLTVPIQASRAHLSWRITSSREGWWLLYSVAKDMHMSQST